MRKLYGCRTKSEAIAKISQRLENQTTFVAYFKNLETASRCFKNWYNYSPDKQVVVDFFVKSEHKWTIITSKEVPGNQEVTSIEQDHTS